MPITTFDAFQPGDHGYVLYGTEGFETFIGPIYQRAAQGDHEFIVQVKPQHCNNMGMAHGGFVLAVADVFLSGSCFLHLGTMQHFVTVNLAHEFLGGAPLGSWLRGRGHVRKEGKSLMFAECEFFIDEESIGVARCVMKKLRTSG